MKKLLAILVIVAALILIGLGVFWSQQSVPDQSPREITIAQAGDFFLYAPLYVALDAGLFEKRNLKVNLVSTGGDEKTWAAVVSKDAAFGVADPTFVAISSQRGQEGRVVASIVNGVPFWGVTFKADIPQFTDASDLRGYTVATFPSPSTAFTLQRQMFLRAGLEPAIREGAFGTLLPMLRSGNADIALELEPNVSQASQEGARVLYALADIYGDFAITGLTAHPATIEERPDLVKDVCCAIQLALDLIRRDREEALSILTKRFPEISSPVAVAALDRVVDAGIIPQTVQIEPDAWRKAIDLRVEVGDLKSGSNVDALLYDLAARWATRSTECRLPPT